MGRFTINTLPRLPGSSCIQIEDQATADMATGNPKSQTANCRRTRPTLGKNQSLGGGRKIKKLTPKWDFIYRLPFATCHCALERTGMSPVWSGPAAHRVCLVDSVRSRMYVIPPMRQERYDHGNVKTDGHTKITHILLSKMSS
jgi:hypothetical protein